MTKELVVYIEPEKWEPNGIRQNSVIDSGVKVSSGNPVEVEVYICPSLMDCSRESVEIYILPEGKDPIDCLLCYSVEDVHFQSSLLRLNQLLLDLHNKAREEFCPHCPPLKLDEKLIQAAQWFAQDMRDYDYYNSDHTDRFGRSVADRFSLFSIDYVVGGENIGWVASDYLTEKDFVQTIFSGWMNSPHHRENILNPSFTEVGFGIASKEIEVDGKRLTKYWFVADFAHLKHPVLVFPDSNRPCTSECMKEIRWRQKVKKVREWDYSSGEPQEVERTIPLPELVFEIPYVNICGIERMQLWGEVSGTLAWIEFNGKGEVSDRLEFIWEPYKSFPLVIDFTEKRPFPGELILLLVYMRGYNSPCNPWIAGYTWFETFCFTSGILLSCCLIDEEGNVVEEQEELSSEWIGEKNLRYRVRFKGKEFLLKCSDYAKYKPYERCIIFKNGITQLQNNEVLQGCRAGLAEPVPESRTLSDSVVSYSLDPEKDIVVPVWFWNEGA
jgi:uncharacterized protein YkwD